ncbi:MAG: ATPase [Myxococcales bacterium]|nr:MAG: ATPase [Myxococcales bacterium]
MSGRRRILTGTPQALLVSSFAGLIGLGTLLLSLPWAHQPGKVGFLDAFFTATSAVCVTGLIVVDTGSDYTLFGQTVILFLIQAGGLGVMTFAALAALILGGRLSLASQAALSDTFLQRDAASEFLRLFLRMLKLVFVIESAGASLLFVFLLQDKPVPHALGSAVFHAVSAFCNAGFSIYSDNLMGINHNIGFIAVVMLLIVSGGLGHIVLAELWSLLQDRHRESLRRFSHHTKIALGASILLIAGGVAGLLLFGLTPEERDLGERLWSALFQSVTARTAGFNTVDLGCLPLASLFFIMLFMFVGGSPGSCAGGIKTTTAAIWLARLKCRLLGRTDTVLLGRTVPIDIVRRVSVLVGLALLWNAFGTLYLLASERAIPGVGMEDLLFEQLSAFGTVGLSTGVTPQLSAAGRLWIILTMFVGRLGPLTLALWMIPMGQERIVYPDGKVMIG